ncbi:hypothetical protein Vadar_017711 [Vaccinium darrowii]|uniref:Uncharacterized protein n=1 Tax=Vaccinium darrowii TaxID=229202 RepID=A0ACB7Z4P2_9ERIC|nr:hypothetical protein Vadar_017711 [Vaccinium darrowii]
MASSRSTNNKYASLNFNDIYQKKNHPSSSSSPSSSSLTSPKTILSNSRIHGNMLVLTRPSPKPIPQPSPPSTPPPPPPPQQQQNQQPATTPDPISLRPLGRTGSGPTLTPSPLTLPKPDKDYSPSPSPKSGRFVPPHLRPGFVGREEKPGSVGYESAWFERESAEFEWMMVSSEGVLLPWTTTLFLKQMLSRNCH